MHRDIKPANILWDPERDEAVLSDFGVAARLAQLTGRERDTVVAVARGSSNAEIARDLFIGPATVKSHVSSVLSKLGLRDRAQVVVFAYESGLVRPGAQ